MHTAPEIFPGLVHNHQMYRVVKVAVVLITFQLAMALLKSGRPTGVAK
jgi:TATA-box binding protein (TBP) (component of TFIID and TFIIIB)